MRISPRKRILPVISAICGRSCLSMILRKFSIDTVMVMSDSASSLETWFGFDNPSMKMKPSEPKLNLTRALRPTPHRRKRERAM